MRISTGYSVPQSITERPFRIIDGVASRRDDAEVTSAQASVSARSVQPVMDATQQESASYQEQENPSQNTRTLRLINANELEQDIPTSARKALQTYLQTEQHADTPANLLSRLDLYV
ncbi:MAG TPA: hypothetical protein VFM46_04860 [Pseudomonadales bacterium]|nr:hypothetical protein [Pseudomonadales bacterium]